MKPRVSYRNAPQYWRLSCTHTENTIHQISPYIGKLKSVIASELIKKYSEQGDLIVDPFVGAGTIALESVTLGRNVFASDVSPYSMVLTLAKLNPPSSVKKALEDTINTYNDSKILPAPILGSIPKWVKQFFHAKTLIEIVNFAKICREKEKYFLLACLLGILHHQRPGFLSHPASHLVPYIRDKKFPRDCYPHLYEYRPLLPRMLKKIERAYKRFIEITGQNHWKFMNSSIEDVNFPESIDCIITSPPYMNNLDYERDNRLRLWFVNPDIDWNCSNGNMDRKLNFINLMNSFAFNVENHLKEGGYCVLIIGEESSKNKNVILSKKIREIMSNLAPSLSLISIINDEIPDIRRSRKYCRGTKKEKILIFRRN